MDRVSGLLNQPTHFFPELTAKAALSPPPSTFHKLINPLIPSTLSQGMIKSRLSEVFKIAILGFTCVVVIQIVLLARNYLSRKKEPVIEPQEEQEWTTANPALDRMLAYGKEPHCEIVLNHSFTSCFNPEPLAPATHGLNPDSRQEYLELVMGDRERALPLLKKLKEIPLDKLELTEETRQYHLGRELDQIGASVGIVTKLQHEKAFKKLYLSFLVNKEQLHGNTFTRKAQEGLKHPRYTFLIEGSQVDKESLLQFLTLFEEYTNMAESASGHTQTQLLAFSYLVRLLSYMQESWIRLCSSQKKQSEDVKKTPEGRVKEFNAALSSAIGRFNESNTSCVDQVLSQVEDIVGQVLLYLNTDSRSLRPRMALKVVLGRREQLKRLIIDYYKDEHQADYERAVTPHVLKSLNLPVPKLNSIGAQFGIWHKHNSQKEGGHEEELRARQATLRTDAELLKSKLLKEFDPIDLLVTQSTSSWFNLIQYTFQWYVKHFRVEDEEDVSKSEFLQAIFPEGKSFDDFELTDEAAILLMICEGVLEVPASLFSDTERFKVTELTEH